MTDDARADFFDSLTHSAAVVGINTTAMIEAAIVGKSVLTVLSPEFAQESTLHFDYLLEENGGFLHVAGSLDEHVAQLAQVLAGGRRGRRTPPPLRRVVRPPARARQAGYADLCRRDRGARDAAGPALAAVTVAASPRDRGRAQRAPAPRKAREGAARRSGGLER